MFISKKHYKKSLNYVKITKFKRFCLVLILIRTYFANLMIIQSCIPSEIKHIYQPLNGFFSFFTFVITV